MSDTSVKNGQTPEYLIFETAAEQLVKDAAWETYLSELANIGLEQYLANAQAAYDRQK